MNSGLCHPGWPQRYSKDREQRNKYLDLARELKTMENEDDNDTNCNWHTQSNPQRICKGTRRSGNKRKTWDHPGYSIIKICQNTKKYPGDLRRLADTQFLLKNHQLMLVWKTLKEIIIIEENRNRYNWVGESDSLDILQKTEVWSHWQMVYIKTRIGHKNDMCWTVT